MSRRPKLEITDRSKAGRMLLRALELGARPALYGREGDEQSKQYDVAITALGYELSTLARRKGWRP